MPVQARSRRSPFAVVTIGVVSFQAICGGSPLDSDCLSLALRAQPLRLGNVHASVAAALALRGCRQRYTYLTASTKTFSPSASDSCKPAVESFHTIAFACVWREAPYRNGSVMREQVLALHSPRAVVTLD